LLLFKRTMSVSLYRLIRASMGSFPATFVASSRNREYLDTFCILCRGGHLYPWEINTLLHNRAYFSVHTSFVWGPIDDPSQSPFFSATPQTHPFVSPFPLYLICRLIGALVLLDHDARSYTIWVDWSGWPLQSIIDQLASLFPPIL
jgi:hypothetical protein